MKLTLDKTAEVLRGAQKIVLTAHVNPDGDAIGSSLGLMHILREMGKEVSVIIDDDIPSIFSILPGVENIQKTHENMQEVPADLLVVLDTALDRIGKVQEFVKAPVLNIDHHITNKEDKVRVYVDPKRAATCEIVYELAKELEIPFTRNSALCIYTGIATDSGFFRYSNTTPFTMRAAAELMEYEVMPNYVSEAMELKSYEVVQGMAKALSTMNVFHDGKAAGLFLDDELSASIESTEGFIDMIRVIEGVDVAVLLKCKAENVCRVSMRSKRTDVSSIAMSFGGGGHIKAAGCTLEMPFEQAKKTIIEAIDQALGQQG